LALTLLGIVISTLKVPRLDAWNVRSRLVESR